MDNNSLDNNSLDNNPLRIKAALAIIKHVNCWATEEYSRELWNTLGRPHGDWPDEVRRWLLLEKEDAQFWKDLFPQPSQGDQ